MAVVVYELWERNDANLFIVPATVPIERRRPESRRSFVVG